MMNRHLSSTLVVFGAATMATAFALDNITLANSDYRGTFIVAAVLVVIADSCLVVGARYANVAVRAMGLVLMLPTIPIVVDLLRRGSYVFS